MEGVLAADPRLGGGQAHHRRGLGCNLERRPHSRGVLLLRPQRDGDRPPILPDHPRHQPSREHHRQALPADFTASGSSGCPLRRQVPSMPVVRLVCQRERRQEGPGSQLLQRHLGRRGSRRPGRPDVGRRGRHLARASDEVLGSAEARPPARRPRKCLLLPQRHHHPRYLPPSTDLFFP